MTDSDCREAARVVLDSVPDGWAKLRGRWVLLTEPAQEAAMRMGFIGERVWNSTAILDAIVVDSDLTAREGRRLSKHHHHHGKPSWAWEDEQRISRHYAALDVVRSLTGAWARWLVPR